MLFKDLPDRSLQLLVRVEIELRARSAEGRMVWSKDVLENPFTAQHRRGTSRVAERLRRERKETGLREDAAPAAPIDLHLPEMLPGDSRYAVQLRQFSIDERVVSIRNSMMLRSFRTM